MQVGKFRPHILTAPHDDRPQQSHQNLKFVVCFVALPLFYVVPVFPLQPKINVQVVHNDGLGHVSAHATQVLNMQLNFACVDALELQSMLSVKSVRNASVHIELVKDLVSVLLVRRRENHDLVELTHLLEELESEGPHFELYAWQLLSDLLLGHGAACPDQPLTSQFLCQLVRLCFVVVAQSLVKVHYQSVGARLARG